MKFSFLNSKSRIEIYGKGMMHPEEFFFQIELFFLFKYAQKKLVKIKFSILFKNFN